MRSGGRWRVPGGSVTVKVVPVPPLSTAMVPPCSSTSSLHQRQADARAFVRARPRALDAMEALEELRQLLGGDAGARVPHRQLHVVAGVRSATAMLPVERELQRVRQQVEDDLLPHVPVDVDRLGQRRAVDLELQPGALDGRAEGAREVGGERRRSIGSIRRPAARPGLDAREVEQRVHQLQQPQRVAVDESPGARAVSAPSGEASAPRSGPSISVSGVRNSWLTLVKNAVFARSSSASASARCRSSS